MTNPQYNNIMINEIPTRGSSTSVASSLTESLLEEATPENSQRFLDFCQAQIDKMIEQSKIACFDGMPGYAMLNQALMDYQSINNGLIYLYEMAKDEEFQANEKFEDWYATKYTEERAILNPRDVAAQKWLSQREIELHIRHKYQAEYKKFNNEKQYASMQVAFLRRLLDGWASQHFILSRLCKNVDSEVKSYTGRTAETDDGRD